MQCNEIQNYFADYLAEDLDALTQEEFSRHLKECAACRSELEVLTDLWVKLGSVPYGEPASPDLDVRLCASAEAYRQEVQNSRKVRWRWPALATAVAALVLAIFLPATVMRSAPAIFEDGAGSRGVHYGELVRSSGSGTLKFADGARLEMRAEAEVSFERSGDSVRVHVRSGDVIATAAQEAKGQVHVETKDISAVGNVFLVNAKEEGSRVAAITGETRVQRGATEKKLLPGEQISTNPRMESLPMKVEMGWSRQAEAQLALLQQSAIDLFSAAVSQGQASERFEVASVKPVRLSGGGRGSAPLIGCSGLPPQVDPSRFTMTANLYTFIALSYGKGGCLYVAALDLLSGGADWVRNEQFEIQATMPAGFPSYTPIQLMKGDAPRLQAMIRTLLEDRFGLNLRREPKLTHVSLLKVGRASPTLTAAADSDKVFNGSRSQTDANGQPFMKLEGGRASMRDLANSLTFATLRQVLDRTGLAGEFNYAIEYDVNGLVRPIIKDALREQLHLELQNTEALVEFLVIERAEKPSDTFEEASIRPSAPAPLVGARGGGGGSPLCTDNGPLGIGSVVQIDPAQFTATGMTLYTLIAWAYDKSCADAVRSDLILGGPGWIRSDRFDVHALIPKGSPLYTPEQLANGAAPALQRMLRTLLAQRFKLMLRSEMKETPAYALVLGQGPLKMKESQAGAIKQNGFVAKQNPDGQLSSTWGARKISTAEMVRVLASLLDRPVLDKTGLTGQFSFNFNVPSSSEGRPARIDAVRDQLGLLLEPTNAAVEELVINHVERPSEN